MTDLHPLLQPTRLERWRNHAIDATGATIAAITFIGSIAAVVLGLLGAIFGVGPAV